MNDLRSRNRGLAAVPDEGSAPTSTPPRVRPETEDRSGRRMSRRQSIAERARKLDATASAAEPGDDHKFRSSRPQAGTDGRLEATASDGEIDLDADRTLKSRADEDSGPSSRPNRRRDVAEDEAEDEDRFPWHFQFDDDEPEELQASSPLLSRAFRATTG